MATLTINTTAPEDTRIAAAFGSYLGLGRSATGPEVKAAIVAVIKNIVLSYEQQQATIPAVAGVVSIAPT